MKINATSAATALAVALAPIPCRAAEDIRTTAAPARQPAAFAGASIRLPLGQKDRARPVARLRAGIVDPGSRAGLELGLTRRGKPEMFVAGHSASAVRERMKLNGSTGSTTWIVFGVVLLAVGVLVITNLDSLGDSSE
jgi:hypothetical protein